MARSGREARVRMYRRRRGSETWHYCQNCSNWPTSEYDERKTKPRTGRLDRECEAKAVHKDCRS